MIVHLLSFDIISHYILNILHLKYINIKKVVYGSCVGIVVSVPVTRSAHFGFESRRGASPQGSLRGGRLLCEYCTNKLIKLGPGRL